MQLTLTITADTSYEMAEAIRNLSKNLPAEAKAVTKAEPVKTDTPVAEDRVPDPPATEEKTTTRTTEKGLRAIMQEKSASGKRVEVKALLTEFTGDIKKKLQDLDPSQYDDFKLKLEKL